MALAECLSADYELLLVTQRSPTDNISAFEKKFDRVVGLPVTDPPDFASELKPQLRGGEIVVVDGYRFSAAYQEQAKQSAGALICIDDIPDKHYTADVIFNFSAALPDNVYDKEFYTRVYGGIGYVLLRSPFQQKIQKEKKFNGSVFINMGGADIHNHTRWVVDKIIGSGFDGDITIVTGPGYQFKDSLEAHLNKFPSATIKSNLDAPQMREAMMSCSIAIVPPSTVAYEFISTGGLLFVLQTAENQSLLKEYLIREGMAFDFSSFDEVALRDVENSFYTSYEKHRAAFDGNSGERLRAIFHTLDLSTKMVLRRAAPKDIELTFRWANDPDVRRFAYTPDPIPWETHQSWYPGKISSEGVFYFIAMIGEEAAGQIRFDWTGNNSEYLISYLLDSSWRGKGLASSLIIRGIQKLTAGQSGNFKITGYVMKENLGSVKAFINAGFKKREQDKYPNSYKFELALNLI